MAEPIEVECPYCYAKPNDACLYVASRPEWGTHATHGPYAVFHDERRQAARAKKKP